MGASFLEKSTGGIWSEKESAMHINVKELMAAFLAIQTFAKEREKIAIHCSSVIHKQTGGHQISRFRCSYKKYMGLVSNKGNNSISRIPAWGSEHHSGLALEEHSRLERLESRSPSVFTNSDSNRPTGSRSLCFETKFQANKVCQLETRPTELCNRCISPTMDQHKGLRVSPILLNRSLSCQDKERQSNIDPNSSNLASPVMVSHATGNDYSRSDKDSNFSKAPICSLPSGGNSPSHTVRNSDFSSMEDIGGPAVTAGLSKTAAKLHEKAWRPGTRIAYKSSWGKWVSWCNERSINYVQTTVDNVIEFLTKLHIEGLQYRTINTYRSAISQNHSLIDGVQVVNHPLIIRHTRAIFSQKPPTPKYDSSWAVDKVLNEIISWGTNESMAIKLLSWKLVMLLALSSAGRASELGMLNCKYLRQQGSIMTFELPKLTKTC